MTTQTAIQSELLDRLLSQRGLRPWHVRTLLVREPGDLMAGEGGSSLLVRIGKARSRSR